MNHNILGFFWDVKFALAYIAPQRSAHLSNPPHFLRSGGQSSYHSHFRPLVISEEVVESRTFTHAYIDPRNSVVLPGCGSGPVGLHLIRAAGIIIRGFRSTCICVDLLNLYPISIISIHPCLAQVTGGVAVARGMRYFADLSVIPWGSKRVKLQPASGIFLVLQLILANLNNLLEMAHNDGVLGSRIYLNIILPLHRSALGTLGFITLLNLWNNCL